MKSAYQFTDEQAKIQIIVVDIISEIIEKKPHLYDEQLVSQLINKYERYIAENKLRLDNYRKERIIEFVSNSLEHNYHMGQLFE